MITHWTKFPGRPHGRFRRDGVRVTMGRKGEIYLNRMAWEALGRPRAVEMMFDKRRQVIGLLPSDESVPEAFPVKDKHGGRGKMISASAFCSHFLIKMMRTALFNEIEIDNDGVMQLSLSTISAVSRGAR